MIKKDKLTAKIFKLNKAWRLINQAIALLKETFKNDSDVNVFIWKFIKVHNKLQSFVSKKIERDYINSEIDKMEKRLKDGGGKPWEITQK